MNLGGCAVRVAAQEKREVEVLTDITCDLCGKTCRDSIGVNLEFATLSARWGYGSRKDCETHEAHICEDCYDGLPFRDKVRVKEYAPGVN